MVSGNRTSTNSIFPLQGRDEVNSSWLSFSFDAEDSGEGYKQMCFLLSSSRED